MTQDKTRHVHKRRQLRERAAFKWEQFKEKKPESWGVYRINYSKGVVTLPKEWWQKIGVKYPTLVELRKQDDRNVVIVPLRNVDPNEPLPSYDEDMD